MTWVERNLKDPLVKPPKPWAGLPDCAQNGTKKHISCLLAEGGTPLTAHRKCEKKGLPLWTFSLWVPLIRAFAKSREFGHGHLYVLTNHFTEDCTQGFLRDVEEVLMVVLFL